MAPLTKPVSAQDRLVRARNPIGETAFDRAEAAPGCQPRGCAPPE
jgi:hypothetical protein